MSLLVSETKDGVKIQTDTKFTFECHREMRAAYEGRPAETKYIVDFGRTDYIDSSALGMLLLLREAGGGDNHKIELINCKSAVKNVFLVANFDQMFMIS